MTSRSLLGHRMSRLTEICKDCPSKDSLGEMSIIDFAKVVSAKCDAYVAMVQSLKSEGTIDENMATTLLNQAGSCRW